MAKEQTTSSSPRRILVIGVGSVVLLAIGAAALLTRDDDTPVRTLHPDVATSPSIAAPDTHAFRFTKVTRELVRTAPGRIKAFQRTASVRAALAARTILDDLYTEGFLEPGNWKRGEYVDAFSGFARGARKRAEARPGLLTAGSRAGDRFEQILPLTGRLDTRVLLGRGGRPTLLLSAVRFSAAALGPEPVTFRSRGRFFFERIRGSWRIVSFHVTRTDAPRGSA